MILLKPEYSRETDWSEIDIHTVGSYLVLKAFLLWSKCSLLSWLSGISQALFKLEDIDMVDLRDIFCIVRISEKVSSGGIQQFNNF